MFIANFTLDLNLLKYHLAYTLLLFIVQSGMMQNNSVYLTGTIGKYPVCFSIDCSAKDGSCSGSYFYKNKKLDIDLEGKANTNDSYLLESPMYAERITLKRSGGNWVGKWSNDKRSLDVNLQEVIPEKLHHNFGYLAVVKKMKAENDWAYMRWSDLVLKEDSITFVQGKKLTWLSDGISGFSFFTLDSTYCGSKTKIINDFLTGLYIQELEDKSVTSSWTSEPEYSAWIGLDGIYLSKDFISFTWNTAGYAAHYFFSEEGFTLSLKTGQAVRLEDFIWFGKGKPFNEDNDNFGVYQSDTLAPHLVKLIAELYPDSIKEAIEYGCEYKDPYGWDYPTWQLTQKGLYVGCYLGSMDMPCNYPEWTIIPYDRLRKYRNKYSKFKLP